uniref:Mevalonate kinase n=1 Tax=Rhizophora mucronata TaxID=61149 RepID=A0A2P2JUY5_RHIMU
MANWKNQRITIKLRCSFPFNTQVLWHRVDYVNFSLG